jgi:hypothetical protein
MKILIGAALLVAAGVLIFIGIPNPTGGRRKMLRLEVVLALILSFIGLGAAALFSGLLTG